VRLGHPGPYGVEQPVGEQIDRIVRGGPWIEPGKFAREDLQAPQ
jgi:hypothetical protein